METGRQVAPPARRDRAVGRYQASTTRSWSHGRRAVLFPVRWAWGAGGGRHPSTVRGWASRFPNPLRRSRINGWRSPELAPRQGHPRRASWRP